MLEVNPKVLRHPTTSVPVPVPAGFALLSEQPPSPNLQGMPFTPLSPRGSWTPRHPCRGHPLVGHVGPDLVLPFSFPRPSRLSWDLPLPRGLVSCTALNLNWKEAARTLFLTVVSRAQVGTDGTTPGVALPYKAAPSAYRMVSTVGLTSGTDLSSTPQAAAALTTQSSWQAPFLLSTPVCREHLTHLSILRLSTGAGPAPQTS